MVAQPGVRNAAIFNIQQFKAKELPFWERQQLLDHLEAATCTHWRITLLRRGRSSIFQEVHSELGWQTQADEPYVRVFGKEQRLCPFRILKAIEYAGPPKGLLEILGCPFCGCGPQLEWKPHGIKPFGPSLFRVRGPLNGISVRELRAQAVAGTDDFGRQEILRSPIRTRR